MLAFHLIPLFLPPSLLHYIPLSLHLMNSTMFTCMSSTSSPFTLHSCKMLTTSSSFLLAPNIAHNSSPRIMKLHHPYSSHNILLPLHFFPSVSLNRNSSISKRTSHIVLAQEARDPGPSEEHSALETVLKLYEAIKNKNVNQLSDIIAEECFCVSNFVSAFQPYLGKKQVMAFFSSLMAYLGNNIEIVVQQTLDDGMVVGVSWKLEWKKVPLHLGKGFCFYTCHVYQGKVMIKNVEMFLEPILHMEPLRLKLMYLVMAATDKLIPHFIMFKNRARKAIFFLLIILYVAALVCLFKYGVPT